MARTKKTPDRKNTAIRFPLPLHSALVAEADRREVSVNLLVTWAVERYLALAWAEAKIEEKTEKAKPQTLKPLTREAFPNFKKGK